ncbi:MAG TPA: hypothetical protein ENH00_00255 [Actinobacteria bacterium]|nr:hypothetical protein [Actinomycetota bacterium]
MEVVDDQGGGFALGIVRGYAFDLLGFSCYPDERRIPVADVVTKDLFDCLDWQTKAKQTPTEKAVCLDGARRFGAGARDCRGVGLAVTVAPFPDRKNPLHQP